MTHQSFQSWQRSPQQGAISSPVELSSIEDAIKTALPWLEQAYCLMNSNRLDTRYRALYVAVCDAVTAAQEAVDRLDDASDNASDEQLYDVAKETSFPVNGKIHPSETAF
jgi:hypothetical protein